MQMEGGQLPLDQLLGAYRRGAELLFQVLTEREERSAIAIASIEPFSAWTKTFTDPRLCAAVVDRLTFAGQIIETGTHSYRLSHARNAQPPRATGAKSSRPTGAKSDCHGHNARTEGYNRIVKHVGRIAFGFRNPDNQRRRVRWACTRRSRQVTPSRHQSHC